MAGRVKKSRYENKETQQSSLSTMGKHKKAKHTSRLYINMQVVCWGFYSFSHFIITRDPTTFICRGFHYHQCGMKIEGRKWNDYSKNMEFQHSSLKGFSKFKWWYDQGPENAHKNIILRQNRDKERDREKSISCRI